MSSGDAVRERASASTGFGWTPPPTVAHHPRATPKWQRFSHSLTERDSLKTWKIADLCFGAGFCTPNNKRHSTLDQAHFLKFSISSTASLVTWNAAARSRRVVSGAPSCPVNPPRALFNVNQLFSFEQHWSRSTRRCQVRQLRRVTERCRAPRSLSPADGTALFFFKLFDQRHLAAAKRTKHSSH